jgi:hypothetical protein
MVCVGGVLVGVLAVVVVIVECVCALVVGSSFCSSSINRTVAVVLYCDRFFRETILLEPYSSLGVLPFTQALNHSHFFC